MKKLDSKKWKKPRQRKKILKPSRDCGGVPSGKCGKGGGTPVGSGGQHSWSAGDPVIMVLSTSIDPDASFLGWIM